jgi:capsular polysaccharide biosynthesis protein
MNKSPEFVNSNNNEREQQSIGQNFSFYLSILWKWKLLAIAIVLVFTTASVTISLLLPQTFQSTSLLALGKFKDQEIESFIDVKAILYADDSLQSILGILENDNVLDTTTMSGLFDIAPYHTPTKDIISQYIQISGRGGTPKDAVEVVNAVNQFLLSRHENLFEEAEKKFELEIKAIVRDKEKTEADILQKEHEIERISNDIVFYQDEINKRADAQSEGQGRIVESYINLTANLKTQREARITKIEALNKDLKNFDILFQQKDFEKAYRTKNTSITSQPSLPDIRIAPNRKEIVLSSTVIGFLVSLFICFAYEFILVNKEYFKKKKKEDKTIRILPEPPEPPQHLPYN